MEELAAVPTATAVAAAAAKRKDLMDNIGSRLNSGAYNAAKNLKKNEKDLREKVKFFEKKEVAGQLKDYMVPRLRLAKDLLVRIQELKGEKPNATVAPARPATAARNRARPATVAAATVSAPTLTTTLLNSVNRARRGLTIKVPKATRFAKTVKLTRATKSLSPVKSAKSARTTTSRKRANKEVIMNEHFMQAMNEFLPLPVLHDPFTGKQYAPEENPMPEIERAYDMLKNIRVKMQRRAGQLRSRAKTANKRRATAASRKKTVTKTAIVAPIVPTTLASQPASTPSTSPPAATPSSSPSKANTILPF